MQLKSLELENIRTYRKERIEFPKSSILLSGDIGSGKSSILLAIEFALFGIMRGELLGESILRKDSNEASVTLTFELEGVEIEVHRRLKKGARGIQQTSGHIKENGVLTQGTPIEIKSRILHLLGYPQSLLSGKNLLYRYTIYTPQEELKRIIVEDKDSRLDVLRKVLLIDKYKLIRNNMQIYLSSLRDMILQAEAKLEKLPERKREKLLFEEEILTLKKKLDLLSPSKNEVFERKELQKKNVLALEEKMSAFKSKKEEYRGALEKEESIKQRIKRLEEQNLLYSKKLEELSEIPTFNIELLKKQIQLMESALVSLDDKYAQLLSKKAGIESRIKSANEVKEKFSKLDLCPTCLQEVDSVHKHTIFEKQNMEIELHEKELSQISLAKVLEERKEQQRMIEGLKNKLKDAELFLYKQKQKEEYQRYVQNGKVELEELKKSLLEVSSLVLMLKESLKESPEEAYLKAKKNFEALLEEESILLQKLVQIKTSLEDKTLYLERVEKEISGLLLIESAAKKQKNTQSWIKEQFLNVLDVIEKHVFYRIQQEFNSLFEEWFNLLIEEEHIQARIDENFSPIIEQNGYEIEFSDLSGGEKSSVALAYRLALNSVINTLVSGIKTTDLLVLDEPTDGFSSAQLDKLRDVLEQIKVNQLLLVSHEPKIESFVNHVIRIEKHEGISRVKL